MDSAAGAAGAGAAGAGAAAETTTADPALEPGQAGANVETAPDISITAPATGADEAGANLETAEASTTSPAAGAATANPETGAAAATPDAAGVAWDFDSLEDELASAADSSGDTAAYEAPVFRDAALDAPAFDAPAFDAATFEAPAFDAAAFDAATFDAAVVAPSLSGAAHPAAGAPADHLAADGAARAGSGHQLLAKLTTDPRMVWWLERTVMAVFAGAVLTVSAGWRFGLTGAALVASLDAIFRSRTTGVIPATALVGSAQRRTRWRLARLAPAGYFSLHSRVIPGAGSVIDHLVVGPAGVYAVTSEHWDRRLPVRATQHGKPSRSAQLYHGPFSQSERLARVHWQAAQAGVLLGRALGRRVTVRPAMAIYGPTVPWVVIQIDGVDVFGGRRLRRYLRREAGARRGGRLTDEEIELIHAAAARALPPAR